MAFVLRALAEDFDGALATLLIFYYFDFVLIMHESVPKLFILKQISDFVAPTDHNCLFSQVALDFCRYIRNILLHVGKIGRRNRHKVLTWHYCSRELGLFCMYNARQSHANFFSLSATDQC